MIVDLFLVVETANVSSNRQKLTHPFKYVIFLENCFWGLKTLN